MVWQLRTHNAPAEDPSSNPIPMPGSSFSPVTPAPEEVMPLAAEGICTLMHIPTYKYT